MYELVRRRHLDIQLLAVLQDGRVLVLNERGLCLQGKNGKRFRKINPKDKTQ